MAALERLEISLTVNGEKVLRLVDARRTLADFLRDDLSLTGTHVGCEQGACGACTVLLDGAPVRSCLVFAVQADGRSVETVEGLAESGRLNALQSAFSAQHALQCGFCTPGFLMAATALLRENPHPSAQEVREGLSGQICRCTGYANIVEAVLQAAEEV